MGPAYVRLGLLFEGWTVPVGLLATAPTWVVPPVAYDLWTRRSVHHASITGIGFSLASFLVMVAVIASPLRGWIEATWLS